MVESTLRAILAASSRGLTSFFKLCVLSSGGCLCLRDELSAVVSARLRPSSVLLTHFYMDLKCSFQNKTSHSPERVWPSSRDSTKSERLPRSNLVVALLLDSGDAHRDDAVGSGVRQSQEIDPRPRRIDYECRAALITT